MEFLERIVAIIPPPWQNQLTYWGVLAPHHHNRAAILEAYSANEPQEPSPFESLPSREASQTSEPIEDGSKQDPKQEDE